MKLLVNTIAAIYAQDGSISEFERLPISVGSCFTCNSMTWDECNRTGRIEKCMDTEQVCEVEVRFRNGNTRQINMGCKWAQACQDNKIQNFAGPNGDREFSEYQCKPWSWHKPSICRQCCNEDSSCGLDLLKEGKKGYGPRSIRGWQKNLIEYESLGSVTEKTPVSEPVTDGCIPKVNFEAEDGVNFSIEDMQSTCSAKASVYTTESALGETYTGYISFFRNQNEYNQYKLEVPKRYERIGYFQDAETGNWTNSDGSAVTFTDWDTTFYKTQPEHPSRGELCAGINNRWSDLWHDVRCNWFGDTTYFSCRLETTC